ncbi:MAG TPA: hypothetical protein VGR73_07490 [Bryobacteraceae bacterium]|nr:hypothetical protein [Bryobacteraceae bacterium]
MKRLSLVLFAVSTLWGQDPLEIVQRSVERDWTDFTSRKDYTYQQHFELREYTRDGRVNNQRNETKEIMILGGWPSERLIARNDVPLSERDARRERQKFEREIADRQNESAADRARHEKERAEDRKFIRELPDAFTFHLDGVESVSGQPAWVIEADPKPSFHPVHSRAQLFAKVRAKVWIEQDTYHWVKADIDAIDTLTFGFGLLRVAPGGTLHFEQTRVNDEIWLPSHASIRADARLALVKKVRAEIDIRYSDYRKFQADSQIVQTIEH